MKLKKYVEFKKINESLSFSNDIESFISKAEYLIDNFEYEVFCDDNIYKFMIESRYINDIEDELNIYDFDVTRDKDDAYTTYIIMPINFKSKYDIKDFENKDFELDKALSKFGMEMNRFRDTIGDDQFTCIYGTSIYGYEVWGDSTDPESGYTKELANLEYIKWQYNKKQTTNDNTTNT